MSVFTYRGMLASGEEVKGERRASSRESLQVMLAQEGIIVVDINRSNNSATLKAFSPLRSKRELVSFTRQMSVMLRNSMRLDAIIRALLRQKNSKTWQTVLHGLGASLSEGQSLSQSLALQPTVFDNSYVSLVRAGESSGDLSEIFSRLAKSLETSDRLKRKIKAALAYPAVIMAVAAIVLFVLLLYIVPVFKEMFLNFQTELPPLTKIVISLSDNLSSHTLTLILILLSLGVAVMILNRATSFARLLSQVPLHIPGLRNLIIKSETATFSRTLATLLWGGVALNEAILLAASGIRNVLLRRQFESASAAISSGSTLHLAWIDKKLIPPMVAEMVALGEETGQLAKMFDSIAEFYSEEVETLLPAMTAILEPLLIVLVGIFVAAILISMYMPLFELIGQLG